MKLLFIFIIFITLNGACVAYIGDWIGRKVGRKKISIFSLRPKYSGIILTILMGIILSIISFGILLLFSENARFVFFSLDNPKKEVIETEILTLQNQKELTKTKIELAKITKSKKQLKTDLDKKIQNMVKIIKTSKNITKQCNFQKDLQIIKTNLNVYSYYRPSSNYISLKKVKNIKKLLTLKQREVQYSEGDILFNIKVPENLSKDIIHVLSNGNNSIYQKSVSISKNIDDKPQISPYDILEQERLKSQNVKINLNKITNNIIINLKNKHVIGKLLKDKQENENNIEYEKLLDKISKFNKTRKSKLKLVIDNKSYNKGTVNAHIEEVKE